ncbi:MAG: phosphatase PAP2 family protein [Candidatus Nanohaloarchaea archaeon]|nr:phosphatase PAP2 family protein [Candidatus Nanohaloarchaea archaeon]
MGLDQAVLAFFTQFKTPGLSEAIIALTSLGSFFQAPVYILTLYVLGKKVKSVILAAGTLVTGATVYVLKNLIARPRPGTAATAVTSGSMPSGHASFAFLAAAVISWKLEDSGWWFYLVAVLVAVTRLVLGVHYPSDVVVGGIMGVAFGKIAIRYKEVIPGLPQG